MIKSIHIQNFQSHANTELEFSPGVNVIVGTSDSGKTAIIRALRWVRWNRPSGDAFRSKWGGSTSVLVECEEAEVSRIKDKSDKFLLRPKGRDEMEFKAFGTNVPEEIVALLNLDEINLQSQHDAPFLISDTPGAVAAHFNKVAHLDKIDIATSKINGWIRELISSSKFKQGEIVKLETQLSDFEYLDKFEAELEVLESLEERRKGLESATNRLESYIDQIEEVSQTIQEAETGVLSVEKEVSAVLLLIEQRRKLRENKQYLESSIQSIEISEKQIKHLSAFVSEEKKVDTLIKLRTDVKTKREQNTQLKKLIVSVTETRNKMSAKQMKLEIIEKKFHDNFPDICPLCDQPIKQK